MNASVFAHDWSFAAAVVVPLAELNFVLPPPVPKMKLRANGLLTNWSISSSYSWIPGHLSRLPNWIGVSPASFAFSTACSNAANVVGFFSPSLLSFDLL